MLSAPDVERHFENGDGRDPGPYAVNGGCICKIRYDDKGNARYEPLCNFDARVTEEVILDDGAETVRAFLIEGTCEGKKFPSYRVPASRFNAMTWVTEAWGLGAVLNAGNGKRDALREAIQRLSPEPRSRRIFSHTGWRVINGKWVYLSGNTDGGNEFEVDLGTELSRYRLPAVADDPVGAMRDSLRLLEVASLRVTAPLFAACYRAPLVSVFPQDLSLWLEGLTGSMKSTVAALFQSHFGQFDRTHLPGAWASTANQLERRAFLLKDSVFVIDDYAPSGLDYREMETKAARLLRAQGNLAGRGRLKSDLTERPAFPPRGIIISTGEQHPPGQSLLARTIIIELDRDDVNVALLSELQGQADRLRHAMAGYIAWLAPQMENIGAKLQETFVGTRKNATTGSQHLRIPEAAAHLWLGLQCGLNYAQDIGAVTEGEAKDIRDCCWAAFLELGHDQALVVAEEQPVRRFLRVLSNLFAQGRAVLVGKDETRSDPKPGVEFLGWQDDIYFYLLPEATFSAVARFCRDTGEHFPIREDRLRRDLAKAGISKCDTGRNTATVWVDGRSHRVVQVHIDQYERITAHHHALPGYHHVNADPHHSHHEKREESHGV